MRSAGEQPLHPGHDPGQGHRGDQSVQSHRQRGEGARLLADLEGACGADAVRGDADREAMHRLF